MQDNMLDTLYNLFQEHLDYRLDEAEIKRTRNKIMELTQKAGIKEDMEYSVLDYGIAYEKAGFRNGFQIAARIFAECMDTDCCGCGLDDGPEIPFES